MDNNQPNVNKSKQKEKIENENVDGNRNDLNDADDNNNNNNNYNDNSNDELDFFFDEDEEEDQLEIDESVDFLNEPNIFVHNKSIQQKNIFTEKRESIDFKEDDDELNDFFQKEDPYNNVLGKKELPEIEERTNSEIMSSNNLISTKIINEKKLYKEQNENVVDAAHKKRDSIKTPISPVVLETTTYDNIQRNEETFTSSSENFISGKKQKWDIKSNSSESSFDDMEEETNKKKEKKKDDTFYVVPKKKNPDSKEEGNFSLKLNKENENKKGKEFTDVKYGDDGKNENENESEGEDEGESEGEGGYNTLESGYSNNKSGVGKTESEKAEGETNFHNRDTEEWDTVYSIQEKQEVKKEKGKTHADRDNNNAEESEMKRGATTFQLKKKTNEDPTKKAWYRHKRHFFMFTYSGKPVFTRYGNEENLTSFFGTLLAIISKMETFCFSLPEKEEKNGYKKKTETSEGVSKNTIKYIISKNTKIVFLDKGVLFLVCISKVNESNIFILNALEYIYLQVISLLTKSVEKALRTKPSYDIRNLLNGSDLMICNLISACSKNVYSLFDGFEPLPLKQNYREKINNAIVKFEINSVLLSLIMINDKIISLSTAKNYSISSKDFIILINMITSTKSFKTVESWTPICLPSHSPNIFMYAYINYIEKKICCVYVCSYSTSKEFYSLSQHSRKLETMLKSTGCYEEVIKASESFPLALPKIEEVDIIHVCYYIPNLKQYYSSKLSDDKMKRIFRVYQKCNDILEEAKVPAQIYLEGSYEKYYCIRTNLYYLYLTVPFYVIINDDNVNKVLRTIAIHHKEIFINNIPLIIN